jgi:hypothetical protein
MTTEIEKLENGLLEDLAAETASRDLGMTQAQIDAWAAQIRAQRAERAAVEERRTSGHWERVARERAEDEVRSGRVAAGGS